VANTLLKIKHRRFGSIDRESNFLVDAIGGEPGEVVLMADKDAGGVVRALAPAVAGFVCTRSHSPRALAPEALADVVRAEGTQLLGVAPDVDSGLALADAAAQTAGAGGVLACGSIYVAGEVRALTLGASGCGAACPDDTVESR
jgi:hypothetical protein